MRLLSALSVFSALVVSATGLAAPKVDWAKKVSDLEKDKAKREETIKKNQKVKSEMEAELKIEAETAKQLKEYKAKDIEASHQKRLEPFKATHEAKLKAAKEANDKALADAKAAYDKSVAAAKTAYDNSVAASTKALADNSKPSLDKRDKELKELETRTAQLISYNGKFETDEIKAAVSHIASDQKAVEILNQRIANLKDYGPRYNLIIDMPHKTIPQADEVCEKINKFNEGVKSVQNSKKVTFPFAELAPQFTNGLKSKKADVEKSITVAGKKLNCKEIDAIDDQFDDLPTPAPVVVAPPKKQ
ncbi:MAG: hypothetical protein EBR09_05070 [Proteobacteria bacterium]|nr:hypothetical protein [Pseudomonadota bacterium]